MRSPAQFFYGVTAQPFRAHIAQIWNEMRPDRVHVPCAGRFTPVCAFVAAGATPKTVTCSDVALISAVIGELSAGRTVTGMGLHLENAEPFRSHANDEVELGAAVLLAAKLAQMPARNLYERTLREHVLTSAAEQVRVVAKSLRRLTEMLHGVDYRTRDIRDECVEYADGTKNELVFLAMPTRMGDYEAMLGAGEMLLGWKGVAANVVSETLREDVHASLLKAKPLVLSVCQLEWESVAPGWHVVATIRQRPGRIDYLVANRPAHARAYDKTKHRAPEWKRLPVYDDHDLTPESVVHLEKLDEPTALHYRGLFVHRLGTTRARSYLGCFVDGQLFGVLGLNAQHFQLGNKLDIFEQFGVCMVTKYHRMSRLMTALLRSGETKKLLEQFDAGFVSAEVEGVRSVSYMKFPVGKSDHRGSTVESTKRLPNGTYEIYYRAPFRDDTWAETFADWFAKHGTRLREDANAA